MALHTKQHSSSVWVFEPLHTADSFLLSRCSSHRAPAVCREEGGSGGTTTLKDIKMIFKQTQNNTEGILEFPENLCGAERNLGLSLACCLIEGKMRSKRQPSLRWPRFCSCVASPKSHGLRTHAKYRLVENVKGCCQMDKSENSNCHSGFQQRCFGKRTGADF